MATQAKEAKIIVSGTIPVEIKAQILAKDFARFVEKQLQSVNQDAKPA